MPSKYKNKRRSTAETTAGPVNTSAAPYPSQTDEKFARTGLKTGTPFKLESLSYVKNEIKWIGVNAAIVLIVMLVLYFVLR